VSRRRRALALATLSAVFGGLAASNVGGREAAIRRQLGPLVPVVVTRGALSEGARLAAERLAVRRVPEHWAPAGAFADPRQVAGLRAAVALPAGADLVAAMVDDGQAAPGAPVRSGERVADVLAIGPPELVRPGVRVDVLVTREGSSGGAGRSRLALEDVEVLASRPAPEARSSDGAPRVAVSLRVKVREAVYLAAAQAFAKEIRLLPRAAGDTRRGSAGLAVDAGLGR
jgi:pilus assembly protein CpaB